LVVGTVFAVDLGGSVRGEVTVFQGDNTDATDGKITAGGAMGLLRIEGAGEGGDGKFGGWIRLDPASLSVDFDAKTFSFGHGVNGIAWWKPIDQLKVSIGVNPDGHWDKNGTVGWMFYQTASDGGVTYGGANVWDGANQYGQGLKYRNALYRGWSDQGLMLEINPIDMIGINIGIPFIAKAGAELKDVFQGMVAQLNLNFDFGQIALTYEAEGSYIQKGNNGWAGANGGTIFASFGGSFGDLGVDFGLGFQLNDKDKDGVDNGASPLAVGLGLKYAVGDFGAKLRAAASFGSELNKKTNILAEVLPYYKLTDSISVYFAAGLGVEAPEEGDAVVGFHINPYIQVGEEWGPKFLAGFKLMSDGKKGSAGNGDDTSKITWAVPITIQVSF